MCKYCENHDKLRVRADFNMTVDAHIELDPEYTPLINLAYTIDGGFFGYETVDIEIPIKFCPYCGKSLEVNNGSN